MSHGSSELSNSLRRELIELGAVTLGESGAIALSPRIRPGATTVDLLSLDVSSITAPAPDPAARPGRG